MFIGPGIMGTIDMMRAPLTLAVMIYLSPIPDPSGAHAAAIGLGARVRPRHVYASAVATVQDQYSVVTSRVQRESRRRARVVQAYALRP